MCWRNRGVSGSEHDGELSAAPGILAALPLRGCLVTGDALYCQRALCAQVVSARGDYLLVVKENQPGLYEDIRLLFAAPPPGEVFRVAQSCNRHGDRTETRRLWASSALNDHLDWPGVQQVAKVERVCEQKGERTVQVRYVLTSCGSGVGPHRLLRAVRGHWGIENRLHYVRDVTMGEDVSHVRTGAAPEVLAALRNAVIAILRADGWQNIAAGLRYYAWHPQALYTLFGLSPP